MKNYTIETYKGYGIDFNFYGHNEYTVHFCGDDCIFTTLEEAMSFIDEVTEDEDEEIVLTKLNGIKTTTFSAGNGFCVDIVDKPNEQMFEAYLYHERYGIKMHMFGLPYEQPTTGEKETFESFVECVAANLETQGYIEFYREEYMD